MRFRIFTLSQGKSKRLYASSISLLSENRSSSFKLHMRSISNSQSALGLPDAIHWSTKRRSSEVQVCVRNCMSNCSSIFFDCTYRKKTIEAGGTTWSKQRKIQFMLQSRNISRKRPFKSFRKKASACRICPSTVRGEIPIISAISLWLISWK